MGSLWPRRCGERGDISRHLFEIGRRVVDARNERKTEQHVGARLVEGGEVCEYGCIGDARSRPVPAIIQKF